MRPALVGAVLILVLAALVPAAPPARGAVSDWTFMIYMAADNNLESVAILDFREMARAGSSAAVNVVVQFDRSTLSDPRVGGTTQYGDWTGTKRFLVERGMNPDPVNATMDLGEANMADPASLVDFVTWAVATYPARHYFLDLWDHGLGWRGMVTDDASGAYLATPVIASALAQVQLTVGRPLDVVGGDSCRMTLEVMYELRPHADYFVGSEKDVPLDGWPYEEFLAAVVASPSMTPVQVGAWLATAYVSSYRDTGAPYAVSLSVVSSVGLPGLISSFNTFVAELNASVPLLQQELIDARLSTERYERAGGVSGGDDFDLYHFSANVASDVGNTKLARLAARLQESIRAAVVANEVWDNPAPINGVRATNAHGLSVWFPDIPTELAYPSLALSRDGGWDEFLAAYRMGSPSPVPTGAVARSFDTTGDGLADRIEVNATPAENGTLAVDLYDGPSYVESAEIPAVADQAESLAFSPGRPGLYTVTVRYYVGGELVDLVTLAGLSVQARYWFNGTVVGTDDLPILGATVTLRNPRTGAIATATTSFSGFALPVVVPDFFLDGDVLVLSAEYRGRVASASFAASPRGTSQMANLVLDTSGTAPDPNGGLVALAAVGLIASAVLAAVALWQHRTIRFLRRRGPP